MLWTIVKDITDMREENDMLATQLQEAQGTLNGWMDWPDGRMDR